jgi:hypothetical protein
MGEHIADLRDPQPGNETDGLYEWEFRAWSAVGLSAIANQQQSLTLPGGYLMWNATWPGEERGKSLESAVNSFLSAGELLSR